MKENNSSFYELISKDENIRSILSLFNCIITGKKFSFKISINKINN